MAEKIKVDLAAMSGDIADMNALEKDAVSCLKELTTAVEALHTTWEGAAHDTLAASFRADQERMNTVMESLQRYVESLNYAKDEYKKCEDMVRDRVGSIQV